jgi:hypothetical protein
MTPEQLKRLVEEAGGIYVGIQSGFGVHPDSVLFQRVKGGSTIAVYMKALRNVHDVELALKADAEKFVRDKFEVGV